MSNFQIGDIVKIVDEIKQNNYGDLGIVREITDESETGAIYHLQIVRGRWSQVPEKRFCVARDEISDLDENDLRESSRYRRPSRERILTEDPIQHIWIRLSLLATYYGARDFLSRRYDELRTEIGEDLLTEKSKGLSFCIQNAKEYFSTASGNNVTSKCLAYYYGFLNLLSAYLISRVDNDLTLDKIEGFTRRGHGVAVLHESSQPFPQSQYAMVLSGGFLQSYLKHVGIDASRLTVARRYDSLQDVSESDRLKVFSLLDLLGRVPELRTLYVEIFEKQPNYLSFYTQEYKNKNKIDVMFSVSKNSQYLSPDKIRTSLQWNADIPLDYADQYGDLVIRTQTPQSESIIRRYRYETYNSVLSDECYIEPLACMNDPLVINFMLLYCLSIWVRYWPALWRDISEGELQKYRPLVENYLYVAERVFPNIVLNRIYGKEFLFTGHSYLG